MKYLVTFLVLALSAGVLHAKPRGNSPKRIGTIGEAISGHNLTPDQVSLLELAVAANPDDLSIHTKLIGYYFRMRFISADAKVAYRKHILWIIKNHPEAEVAGTVYVSIDLGSDPDGYEAAKQLWTEQTDAHPKDVVILGNAADFLLHHDQYQAEILLKEAERLDPKNPKWPDRLGHLYQISSSKAAATDALKEFEKAQAADKLELTKFNRLDDLAKAAYNAEQFDKAAWYAKEMLRVAEKFPDNAHSPDAVHHANIVLGRVALSKGDIKQAKEFLLKAGRITTSPQLESFGPNMALAKELLDAGESETVLQYFWLCRKFWKSGSSKLDAWTKELNADEVPDFGANLNY